MQKIKYFTCVYQKLKLKDDYNYTSDEEEDAKLKLDEETENFIRKIKEHEKSVDRKGFSKYFNHEPSELVSNFLGQNTQDLRKILDEIKQRKIELSKDERNSTNNKNENDRFNMILSVIDRIYQFFEYKYFSKPEKQSDQQQPCQQEQNQDLRLWVTSIYDYTKLKNNFNKHYETTFTHSANNKQFNLNNLKSFLIILDNQKAAKECTKALLRCLLLFWKQS